MEQSVCIWIDNELGNNTKIERDVFSPYLFNLYSHAILRKLEVITEFIISVYNLNDIKEHTWDRVDTKRKLQDLRDKVVKEIEKKELIIKCRKECLSAREKHKIRIENVKLKHGHKCKYISRKLFNSWWKIWHRNLKAHWNSKRMHSKS